MKPSRIHQRFTWIRSTAANHCVRDRTECGIVSRARDLFAKFSRAVRVWAQSILEWLSKQILDRKLFTCTELAWFSHRFFDEIFDATLLTAVPGAKVSKYPSLIAIISTLISITWNKWSHIVCVVGVHRALRSEDLLVSGISLSSFN